jgi:transposase
MRAARWPRWPGQTGSKLRHEPGRCGWCGAGLAGRPATGVERRQVSGLPEAAVAVTEHQPS